MGGGSLDPFQCAIDHGCAYLRDIHLDAKARSAILARSSPAVPRQQGAADLGDILRLRALHIASIRIIEWNELRNYACFPLEHLNDAHAGSETRVDAGLRFV